MDFAHTADDIAFSIEFNRDPEIANANRSAVSPITHVETPDQSTVVVTWSQAYPFADRLSDREFMPVSKRLVERAYRESRLPEERDRQAVSELLVRWRLGEQA